MPTINSKSINKFLLPLIQSDKVGKIKDIKPLEPKNVQQTLLKLESQQVIF